MAPYKLTSDSAAAVAPEIHWIPIDASTPIGVKMLLIVDSHGVAIVSSRRVQDQWTHWCPLPTFKKEILS